jgi:MFS superfamily sulfate permease-like transporter
MIGIAVKLVIHLLNGLPIRSIFKPFLEVNVLDDTTVQVDARGSAVFSNWIPFRRQLCQLGLEQQNNVVVNLEGTKLVDHSVMEGLHQLQGDFERAGLTLEVVGLEDHHALSSHPFATRKRRT